MTTLEWYFLTFGEYPPINNTMSLESDEYENLMMKAIVRKSPLTPEEIEEVFKNVEFDLVTEKPGIKENLEKIFKNKR